MYWLISWTPETRSTPSLSWRDLLGQSMETGGCDGFGVERLIDLLER